MKTYRKGIVVGCVALLCAGMVANAQMPAAKGSATSTAMAKKERLQAAVMNMERALETRIGVLENLAERINSRIQKIQDGGKNMTTAWVSLADAEAKIVAAKMELESLKKADAGMIASARPAAAFGNIRNKSVVNVMAKIKAAHKALVDTIVIMKGQGISATATSGMPVAR